MGTIRAQTSCTLSTIIDVAAVYTYYYLASSTITTDEAPKDNVNQPGASTITVVSDGQNYVWQLTEPTLNIVDDVIQTAVGQLYVIECTLFSNGTYDWGPLMTSSTYAAAKAAYNLSSQALSQAQAANSATSLLGGHFIYNSSWQTTNTPHSANVVQTIDVNGVDKTQVPGEWGYNVHIGANGIRLRNNEIILSEWKSNGLNFYKPTTNNTQGNLTMSLTSSALSFYGSSTSTADATLDSNGLTLIKGGITGGTYSSSSTNFIYLSTNDYSGSPAITINGNSSGWRQIIGSNFGVKNDGTLYASNAHISGAITATSLDLTTNNVKINTNDITGLSAVATSGNYSSLTGTPDLTVYISKDGVVGTEPSGSAASNSSGFIVSSAGILKAANAVITGKMFATSGVIGGWQIGTDSNKSLHNGNANTSPIPAQDTVILSKGITTSNTIGNLPAKTYTITAGTNFGVTTNGILYATDANITGAITATSLTINNTDYASDITTISNKANSADSNWSVIITITSINYTSSTAVLQATVYHKGVKTTSGFTYAWYKNGTGNSLGSTASLTITDLDAYYTCIIS